MHKHLHAYICLVIGYVYKVLEYVLNMLEYVYIKTNYSTDTELFKDNTLIIEEF